MKDVRHATVQVGDVSVFYREAGVKGSPVLLLLHGFANSSHYFRHLVPMLAKRFHLIAPDIPSFGFTKVNGEAYRWIRWLLWQRHCYERCGAWQDDLRASASFFVLEQTYNSPQG